MTLSPCRTLQNVIQTQKCVLCLEYAKPNRCVFKCFANVSKPNEPSRKKHAIELSLFLWRYTPDDATYTVYDYKQLETAPISIIFLLVFILACYHCLRNTTTTHALGVFHSLWANCFPLTDLDDFESSHQQTSIRYVYINPGNTMGKSISPPPFVIFSSKHPGMGMFRKNLKNSKGFTL